MAKQRAAGSDDAHIYGEIQKNSAEVVRVQLRDYQGRRYLDIRTHFWSEDGPEEELRPTKKGISLSVEKLPELRAAIEALAAAVEPGGPNGRPDRHGPPCPEAGRLP